MEGGCKEFGARNMGKLEGGGDICNCVRICEKLSSHPGSSVGIELSMSSVTAQRLI